MPRIVAPQAQGGAGAFVSKTVRVTVDNTQCTCGSGTELTTAPQSLVKGMVRARLALQTGEVRIQRATYFLGGRHCFACHGW